MGIKKSCVVDMLTLPGNESLNGEKLYVDIRAVQGRELFRQSTHIGGSDAASIRNAGNFHTSFPRQVGDEPGVQDVASELIRHVSFHGFHDVRAVLMGTG